MHLAQSLKTKYPNNNTIRSSIELFLQTMFEQKVQQYRANIAFDQTISVMLINNKTYEVMAHIGSADFFQDSQIDLTQVIRSPGSTLKPFIYGLGFEKKLFHPLTQVMDDRFRFDDGYSPENFNDHYLGLVNIKTALLKSLNIPAVKALKRIGVNQFIQRLQLLGIKLNLQLRQVAGLGIALGGAGLSLENLVTMYTALANGGKYQNLFYLAGSSKINKKTILSPLATWYIDDILKQMPQTQHNGSEAIRYKTGTSYGYRDAWSIGYNSHYTIGVWVGRVDGGFTHKQTGSQMAAPLLKQLFSILPTKEDRITHFINKNEILNSLMQLPLHMRFLENNQQNSQLDSPFIIYPLDASKIEILSLDTTKTGILTLKAGGGEPPYFWLVNGKYVSSTSNKGQCRIKAGKQKITLIDSRGKQSHSQIMVKLINE